MEEPAPKRLRTVTADQHILQPPWGAPGAAKVGVPAPGQNAPAPRQDPQPVDVGAYFLDMVERLGPSDVVRDLLVKAATRDPVIAAELAVAAAHHEAMRPHPGLQQQQMYQQPLQNGIYHLQQSVCCYPHQCVPYYPPRVVGAPAPYPRQAGPAPAAAPTQSSVLSASEIRDLIIRNTARSEELSRLEEWTAARREAVDGLFEVIERRRARPAKDEAERAEPSPKRKWSPDAHVPEDKDFSDEFNKARHILGLDGRFYEMDVSQEEALVHNVEHRLAALTSTMVYAMTDANATTGTKLNVVTRMCDILLMILEAPEGPCKSHNMASHSDVADNFRAAVKLLSSEERKVLSLDEVWKIKLSCLWTLASENSVEVSMNVRAVKDLLRPSRVLFPDDDAEEEEEEEEASVHSHRG